MKQKFYDIERRFNETKTGIDTDNHRIKVRVDEQLQDQSRKFEEAVLNSKELVINSVKGDIDFGNKKAEMLRTEVMQLVEQMNNELERKHSKHVNRFESFTVQVDGKLSKLTQDVKKAEKLAEKVSIQGPSGGIYLAHGNQQASMDQDSKLNSIKA